MPRALLSAVVACLAAGPAAAQNSPPRKVAFLVGVGQFQKAFTDLGKSPQKDATELAKVLAANGFEAVTLIDAQATKAEIEKRFRAEVGRLNKGDLLVASFCTHGFTLPTAGKPGGEPFLAATDSIPGSDGTMVSLNGLIRDATPCGATVLFLIDACREVKDVNRGVEVSRDALPPERMAILFGCARGELSYQSDDVSAGHGLFTYAILKILRGEGAPKEEVTWAGLVHEVEETFKSRAYVNFLAPPKRQSPVQANNQLGRTQLFQFKGNPVAGDVLDYEKAVNDGEKARTDHLKRVGPKQYPMWRAEAEKGNTSARFLVAVCYVNGFGVKIDYVQAVRWYQLAADAGHARARNNLAYMYSKGEGGVAQDPVAAFRLYEQAALAGLSRAKYNLALRYENGLGTRPDPAMAVALHQLAARDGVHEAMIYLGLMHQNGFMGLVEKSDAEAFRLFQAASRHPNGLFQLGRCYELARGVKKSILMALQLYQKAADAGDPDAAAALKRLRKK